MPPVTPIQEVIQSGVQFLSIGVGVVLIASMAYAGFQYLTAGDNSNQVSSAKGRIYQLFVSLIMYIFGLALLNYLTPGGIL